MLYPMSYALPKSFIRYYYALSAIVCLFLSREQIVFVDFSWTFLIMLQTLHVFVAI